MNIATPRHQRFYIKLFAVALVIFGARLWLIDHFGSSVPFWDSWDAQAAGLFLPWLKGTLTISDLFAPQNEHRIFFTRFLSLLLFLSNEGQWDPLLEMVVNALLFSLTAIILIILLNNLLGQVFQNKVLLSVTLLWSLPYGWENTLGCCFSPHLLMVLFSLLALWGLLLHDNWTWKWWIGVLCALFAYFNLASGFLVLLVILVLKFYLIIIDVGNRRSHFPTLLISMIITMVCMILLVKAPHHAALMANNLHGFLLAFGKALAWPLVTHPWSSLILYLPFLILLLRTIGLRRQPSRAESFILALGGWVILQAASMAYARGQAGAIPASRYMDILVLGVIVNLFAFHFIAQSWHGLSHRIRPFFNVFAGMWKLLVILGMGALVVTGSWPAIQQKRVQGIEQLKNTREFIRTNELSVLQNKPWFHIPYPSPERLAGLLANPQIRAILPHTLTVPTLLQSHRDDSSEDHSTFVANGFHPSIGKYHNETTLGSYDHLGYVAIARFESAPIEIKRSFMEIPVAGYLGEPGLTLQLVVEGQSEPIIITPPRLAKESWVSCYVQTPDSPFKLVAIDNSSDLWFAFAMPRGLGTWSFLNLRLLDLSGVLLVFGVLLLGIIWLLEYVKGQYYSKPELIKSK